MEDRKSVKVTEKIPVRLTRDDIGRLAVKIAKLEKRRLEVLDEFNGHKKLKDIHLAELKEEIEPKMKALVEGQEEKEMECEKVYLNAKKMVRYLDLRTKAILFERPMTPGELQAEMFEGTVPDPAKEKCKTMICINCNEEWFGGETNKICWNCKKLDQYRFAKG